MIRERVVPISFPTAKQNAASGTGLPFVRVAGALVLALAACGGGDGGHTDPNSTAPIGTLAYVQTGCADSADGRFSATQELRVQRDIGPPLTLARIDAIGPAFLPGLCDVYGVNRLGALAVTFGGFTRIGVRPDGATILYEVTDEFSVVAQPFVPTDEHGIFAVRADGSSRRRLGPASRVASSGEGVASPNFGFSPSGRYAGFEDIGPGPQGEAVQIFTLDVESGARRQVTQLPAAPVAGLDGTYFWSFVDEHTILFITFADADGLNPNEEPTVFTVDVPTGVLTKVSVTPVPGGVFTPTFVITGGARIVGSAPVEGEPENPQGDNPVRELFVSDARNILQLTSFHRTDTSLAVPLLSSDRQDVFFTASADPLGSNPTHACQIFSVDPLGRAVTQLTTFALPEPSALGCWATRHSEGCRTDFGFAERQAQDGRTGTLIFNSSCNPLGQANANSEQIFAMRPDGSGLRQLTSARGWLAAADGSVEAELPGPWGYGPYR